MKRRILAKVCVLFLLTVFASPVTAGEQERLALINRLQHQGTVEAVKEIIRLLNDPSPRVRQRAARAIYELEGNANEGKLCDFIHGTAVPAMARRLKKEHDTATELLLIEYLSQIKNPCAVPALIEKLKSFSAKVRRAAAEAFELIPDRRAVSALCGCLCDPNCEVRQAVARALGEIGSPEAVEKLKQRLEGEGNEMVIKELAIALGRIGKPAQVAGRALLKKLNSCREAEVVAEIARALGLVGHKKALSSLGRLARRREIEVKSAAVFSLACLYRGRQVSRLTVFLSHRDFRVRRAVVEGLEIGGCKEAVPLLIRALVDRDFAVRGGAIWALRKITSRDFEFSPSWPKDRLWCAQRQWQKWWQGQKKDASPEEWLFETLRKKGVKLKAVQSKDNLPVLVESLSKLEPWLAGNVSRLLERVTAAGINYHLAATPEQRRERIEHWQSWLAEHLDRLVWDEQQHRFIPLEGGR